MPYTEQHTIRAAEMQAKSPLHGRTDNTGCGPRLGDTMPRVGGDFMPSPARPRNPITQLGWPHYWLLTAILGGMLALVALVFFIRTQS